MNYKKVVSVGVGGIMMLSVVSPSFALAEATKGKNYCDRLPSLEKSALDRISGLSNKVDIGKEEEMLKLKDTWANFDAKKELNRAKTEAKKVEKETGKEAKLVDNAKKVALANLKVELDSAIKARQTAVDTAVKTFRDKMTTVTNDRKTALEAIATDYKTSITTALDKAKADCAGGIDSMTIKNNFNTAKKDAETKMKIDRSNLTKESEVVKSLVDERTQAVEKARADFKAVADKLKTDFKTTKTTETAQ